MGIKLMAYGTDGKLFPIGTMIDISETILEDPPDKGAYVLEKISDEFSFTMKLKMPRKMKRGIYDIFEIPKYRQTEYLFPKKKKRGSIRRRRKAGKRT